MNALLRASTDTLVVVFFINVCLAERNLRNPDNERDVKQVIGVVVAYDNVKASVPCSPVCQTSLIVRVDEQGREKEYIRIDVTFRDRSRFPKELLNGKKLWKFSVVRRADRDEKIEEFLTGRNVYGQEIRESIWTRVNGAEDQKLPSGECLPCYLLIGQRTIARCAITQPTIGHT